MCMYAMSNPFPHLPPTIKYPLSNPSWVLDLFILRGHVGVFDFGGWDCITSAKYKITQKNVQYIYSICTQISMSFPWPSRPTKRSKRPKEGDKELVAFKDWGKVDNCGVKQSEREKNLGWFERKCIRNLKYLTSQFRSPRDLETITADLETIAADLETMIWKL